MNSDRDLEVERRLAVLETENRSQRELLDSIKNTQDAILSQLAVYNGRWGMLVMLGSALMFVTATFKDFILKKLGFNG